jgi:hypothetical protein
LDIVFLRASPSRLVNFDIPSKTRWWHSIVSTKRFTCVLEDPNHPFIHISCVTLADKWTNRFKVTAERWHDSRRENVAKVW